MASGFGYNGGMLSLSAFKFGLIDDHVSYAPQQQ
jgi:hypothetical protein